MVASARRRDRRHREHSYLPVRNPGRRRPTAKSYRDHRYGQEPPLLRDRLCCRLLRRHLPTAHQTAGRCHPHPTTRRGRRRACHRNRRTAGSGGRAEDRRGRRREWLHRHHLGEPCRRDNPVRRCVGLTNHGDYPCRHRGGTNQPHDHDQKRHCHRLVRDRLVAGRPRADEPVAAPKGEVTDPSPLSPATGWGARSVFRRALERRNLLVAEATAEEIGRLGLAEALELTVLIARKVLAGTRA